MNKTEKTIQSTPDDSSLQGKSKKGSSYRESPVLLYAGEFKVPPRVGGNPVGAKTIFHNISEINQVAYFGTIIGDISVYRT